MKRYTKILLFITIFLFSVPTAYAGGLWVYENGSPDMGSASAGRAALAVDASTVNHNPAGMTHLDRSQLLIGIVPMYVDAKFNPGPGTTTSGSDGGNPVGLVHLGSIAYAHKIDDNLSVGIWTGSYFGFGVDYNDDWVGRYFMTKGDLLTYNINPSVSYKINDQLSVGGGINILHADLLQEASIRRLTADDGHLKLEQDDMAFGGNLGVLYTLSENTRFGLTYVSKADLEFDDILTVAGTGSDYPWLNSISVDYEITIPQAVMFSAYHAVTDDLAVMGNIGWQDWSDFGRQDLMVTSDTATAITIDNNYKDTWHVAVGLQHKIGPQWLLSVGFSHDTSLVKDEDRSVDLNADRQYRLATGIQYNLDQDITIGTAYQYVDGGSASIDQSRGLGGPLEMRLQGDYDPNRIHYFNVNLIWRY